MGYFRFWNHARDHAAILENTHDWFKYQHASKLGNTITNSDNTDKSPSSRFAKYSSLATKFRHRSAADDVMMPVTHTETTGLIIDLAICALQKLHGRRIANRCTGRAILCGSYGWRLNPPLYFGLERVYMSTQDPYRHPHRPHGRPDVVCRRTSDFGVVVFSLFDPHHLVSLTHTH
jgi:hypothetical protein